jgi:hypothetical protein
MTITVLRSDPDLPEAIAMEFRLTYEGELLAASKGNTRAPHKHEIRKKFHRQLLRLWQTHPYLKDAFQSHPFTGRVQPEKRLFIHLAEQYFRLGYAFVPLVTPELCLICRVNILFLRPSMPGELMQSGDLDNRLKTIFDALRMPDNKDELGGHNTPGPDENPFCVLMTDDKLISHVSIETDTLLEPTGPNANANDARLVIAVHLHPYNQGWHNINFG